MKIRIVVGCIFAALHGWPVENCFRSIATDRQEDPIRTFVLLGVAAILLGTADARAADPRAGTWTLVSAQSSMEPANKLTVIGGRGGVHVVMSGETRLDFAAKGNGQETAVTGIPAFDHVTMRRIDGKQAEVIEKKNGTVVATIHERVSKDGKELTVTTVNPGHPDRVTVWRRTGGAKSLGDPVAGEWTQDLSKTRMAQGAVVRIEQAGAAGVRFSGEFSYTAQFDGKQYDLRNSRNDTVSLTLADPRTVDSTYRRGDQVTQKDRWVVSADGQQMTLTTTGELESGQHVTEKLIFKKQ